MWICAQVQIFWREIKSFLETFQITLEITAKIVLFGYHKEPINSIINFVLLAAKGYIWKSKFEHTHLLMSSFKKYLKCKLEDLKDSLEYINKIKEFDQWINIYASL